MSCDSTYTVDVSLYKGRDNAVTIVPYSDLSSLVNYDMTDITDVEAYADPVNSTTVGDGYVASNSADPLKVYWDQNNPESEWRIYAKVGLFDNPSAIVAGDYYLRITLFNATDLTNGLVLPDTDSQLKITIVDLP